MVNKLTVICNKVLEMIYPKRCLLCDEILPFGFTDHFCNSCDIEAYQISGDTCEKCGKPLETHRLKFCFDCSRKRHYFRSGRAMWLYQDLVRNSIQRYKYGERKGYGKAFAMELSKYYLRHIDWKIDLITSVPLHIDKFRQRTFNQSALIADTLSRALNIPTNNELLIRVKNTVPQKDLSDIERIHNVEDAFSVNVSCSVREKNILIIDDIYTTGSTIDGCAKVLMNHGAGNVYFLTLAIGKGL